MRTVPRRFVFLALAAAGCGGAPAAPGAPPALPEFRTVDTAITAQVGKASRVQAPLPAYLGVHLGHGLVLAGVAEDSPAAKAGLRPGDVIESFDGEKFDDAEEFRDRVQAATPGEPVAIVVRRDGKRVEATATLAATSRPMASADNRAILGVQTGDNLETGGAPITRVTTGLPAALAGLKAGDVILEVDGTAVAGATRLSDLMAGKRPGDTVVLDVLRGGKTEEMRITLAVDPSAPEGAGFFGGGNLWKKEVYRLAVVGIEYPDVKHNAKIALKDWEESLFSKGTYANKMNVTGQPVHGSLNDYYLEQSCGTFRVEGRMFEWVEAGKKRADYAQGTGSQKTALLSEALDKLYGRDGKEALKDFDGIYFLYAGDRVQTNRGALYWPHRGSVTHQGKRWPYFIVNEGGSRMGSISVVAHEFGHMLGLPDLYARPENPGSEGLGAWCAMSNENRGGRPQHFGAWCKERLGWLKPAVIDPSVKQRLVLGPVEGSTKECFKVLVRPDGSEYLLLENRRKTGFDKDLPAEGLIIWRVVRTRPILEESHGVEGPSGPRVHLASVPYPSAANDAFTPHTTPSSRSQLGGGTPVHITQIRRLPDGRISFSIGFEYD
jgi:M6 family metalloprotease-like protein